RGRAGALAAARDALQAHRSQQAGDALAADADPTCAQLRLDPGRAVGRARVAEGVSDQALELAVAQGPARGRASAPGVVAGRADAEHGAEPGERVLCLLRLDQPEAHGRRSVSRAKKLALPSTRHRNIGRLSS